MDNEKMKLRLIVAQERTAAAAERQADTLATLASVVEGFLRGAKAAIDRRQEAEKAVEAEFNKEGGMGEIFRSLWGTK